MPRKGKGQKIQTAPGQTYGAAKSQEDAQQIVPLAATPETSSMLPGVPPASAPRPGALPFMRPSDGPNRQMGLTDIPLPEADRTRRFKVAMTLPILEQMASDPYASPHLRNTVRKMKAFVGDVKDFNDRNP